MAAHLPEPSPAARALPVMKTGRRSRSSSKRPNGATGNRTELEAAIHASVVRAYAAWTGTEETETPVRAPLALVTPIARTLSLRKRVLSRARPVLTGFTDWLAQVALRWRSVGHRPAELAGWARLWRPARAAALVTYAPPWATREKWDRRLRGLWRLVLFLALVCLLLGAVAWLLLTTATHALHHRAPIIGPTVRVVANRLAAGR